MTHWASKYSNLYKLCNHFSTYSSCKLYAHFCQSAILFPVLQPTGPAPDVFWRVYISHVTYCILLALPLWNVWKKTMLVWRVYIDSKLAVFKCLWLTVILSLNWVKQKMSRAVRKHLQSPTVLSLRSTRSSLFLLSGALLFRKPSIIALGKSDMGIPSDIKYSRNSSTPACHVRSQTGRFHSKDR